MVSLTPIDEENEGNVMKKMKFNRYLGGMQYRPSGVGIGKIPAGSQKILQVD